MSQKIQSLIADRHSILHLQRPSAGLQTLVGRPCELQWTGVNTKPCRSTTLTHSPNASIEWTFQLVSSPSSITTTSWTITLIGNSDATEAETSWTSASNVTSSGAIAIVRCGMGAENSPP